MGMFNRDKGKTTQQLADETGRASGTGNAPARSVSFVKQSGPANQRADVESKGGVDLAKKFDKAGVSLSKRNLDGVRAEAVMLLDYSGSMSYDYSNGNVQTLVERALGFALQIDTDGEIPVIRFGSRAFPPVKVNMGNYSGIVRGELSQGGMGSTNLADALRKLLDMAKTTTAPLYAIVVTDGSPDSKPDATRLVKELSKYPVFIKFLAIQQVDYLDDLDDMPASERLIDNVDSAYISDPANMPDLAFADAMTEEWDTWIVAAQQAGILA